MKADRNETTALMDWMPETDEAEPVEFRDPDQVAQAAVEAGTAVMAREEVGEQFELASDNGMGC